MQDTKKFLGARIQELRKVKNLKQSELAELLDIDSKHISKIECGRCFPSFELLDRIAGVFKVEPYELLQNNHLKPKDEIIKEINVILENSAPEKLKNIYITLKNLL